jgi:thiosulfate reductase cytochrome b subunit
MDGFSAFVILIMGLGWVFASLRLGEVRSDLQRMRDDMLNIYHDLPAPTSNWEDIEVDRQNRAHKKMAKWLGEK